MKLYFKCSSCGKFHEMDEINFTGNDSNEERPLYWNCFANNQDRLAYQESAGEFINYEDWMESRGATICDWDEPRREF